MMGPISKSHIQFPSSLDVLALPIRLSPKASIASMRLAFDSILGIAVRSIAHLHGAIKRGHERNLGDWHG